MANNAITGDVALLPIGYILLVIYATIVLGRSNPVYSYASMATISFLAIGLSILGMWGFGVLMGIQYTLVVNAAFFLLAGLGIDDTFVIMAAHGQTPRDWSPARRVANTMARAGVSITITTVTDACAFAIGTSTSIPAISYFCQYTLIGVIFDFLLQITFFVAFLYWNTKREAAGRADTCVWWRPSAQRDFFRRAPFRPERKNILERFIGVHLPRIILHPVGKTVVLLGTFILAGTSIWAATLVPSRFNSDWFIPESSHVKSAINILEKEFGGRRNEFSMYTGDPDYTALAIQQDLDSLSQALVASQYIAACSNNWWSSFQTYMAAAHAGSVLTVDNRTYAAAGDFYPFLDLFLNTTEGIRFTEMVRREFGSQDQTGSAAR